MLIYDVEIKRAIQGKEARIPGIEYCQGWDDFEGMGIAVVCAYDDDEDTFRVFCEDNLHDFQSLVHHHIDMDEKIVGFNSLRFDNRLVRAHGIDLPDDESWDLLVEIWKAAGLGPDFNLKTHVGFGLDAMVSENFPEYGKAMNGALAPVLWQRGEIGSVIDYCMSDVWLTKMLVRMIQGQGFLLSPKDGSQLQIEPPRPF